MKLFQLLIILVFTLPCDASESENEPSLNEAIMVSIENAYTHELIDEDIRQAKLPLYEELLGVTINSIVNKKSLWQSFVLWVKTFISPAEGNFTSENCTAWDRKHLEDLKPLNKNEINYFRVTNENDIIFAYDYSEMRLFIFEKKQNEANSSFSFFHFRDDGVYYQDLSENRSMYFPLNFTNSLELKEAPFLLMNLGLANIALLIGEFWTPMESRVIGPMFPLNRKGLKPFVCKVGEGCSYYEKREKKYLTKNDTEYLTSLAFSKRRVDHLLKSCQLMLDETEHSRNISFAEEVSKQCGVDINIKKQNFSALEQQCDFALDQIGILTAN
jgi:hypothetical protein